VTCRAIARVEVFLEKSRLVATQLSYLEGFRHDEILPPDVLEVANHIGLDRLDLAFTLAAGELQHSLEHLRQAHGHISGLVKGALSDATEAVLARAITGAENRLRHMRELHQNYKPPTKAYEIRRIAFSFLSGEAQKIEADIAEFAAETRRSHLYCDVGETFDECRLGVQQLRRRFDLFRERSSQHHDLQPCIERLAEIKADMTAAEAVMRERALTEALGEELDGQRFLAENRAC
jgi:hypothetical protein